jgi:L-ascorbate metabolism protein UlaG (beta-lactamase superfamily)
MDPDPARSTGTTRLGFLSHLTRRAAQALPQGVPPVRVEEADELPPPGEMIEPYLSDDAFLEDVEGAKHEDGLHIWWLGQSGFLVQIDGEHLLLDPYLSDSLTEAYAGTSTPHERVTGRVIAPEQLSFVDVVTSSHSHTDHLDPGTLPGVLSGGARLVCAAGSEALALERSGRPPYAALAVGDDVEVGGYRIEAVPAHHEGAPEAVGYVIRNGPFTLYHAGDTRRVQGIAEAVGPHAIDVAFVPVNGRLGNMDGADAARLAYEAGATIAIPCHYEMFRFNTASPARFVAECIRLGQEYRLLAAGESVIIDP